MLTEIKVENGGNGKGEEYFGFFLRAPFLPFYFVPEPEK